MVLTKKMDGYISKWILWMALVMSNDACKDVALMSSV